jgi:hypothetical protein
MNTPATGGCLCGKVRYELLERAYRIADCHCVDCRRSSGAPYVTWGIVKRENFKVTQGELKQVAHADRLRSFAPCCGTPILFEDFANCPELDVTLASLDDPSGYQPERAIWIEDKLPWVCLDPHVRTMRTNRE